MSLIVSRRKFLVGFGSLLAAPLVVRAESLMPISSLHVPVFKYVNIENGVVEGFPTSTLLINDYERYSNWLPCDGRTIRGLDYPSLYKSVRGHAPSREDETLTIMLEDGFKKNSVVMVDCFKAGEWFGDIEV